MNGEAFYEEMKAALRYFQLGWNQKHEMTVTVENGRIVFSYKGLAISVNVNASEPS